MLNFTTMGCHRLTYWNENEGLRKNKTSLKSGVDYYPFGLSFNQQTRENTHPQNYQYNGKELQTDLDLNWTDYGARMYDASIGRFATVDPLADRMQSINPYHYTYNNPINLVDLEGLEPSSVQDLVQKAWDATPDGQSRTFNCKNGECEEAANAEAVYWRSGQTEKGSALDSNVNRIRREMNYLGTWAPESAGIFKNILSSGKLSAEEIAAFAKLRTELVGKIKAQYAAAIFSTDNVLTILGIGIFGFPQADLQNRLAGIVARGAGNASGQGFSSFRAFKQAFGAAGKNKHWHHLVEQTPGNIERFGNSAIQNTNNLVKIPSVIHVGRGSISAHYSRILPFTNGQTVRQWLGGKSFQTQMQYALKILERASNGLPLY